MRFDRAALFRCRIASKSSTSTLFAMRACCGLTSLRFSWLATAVAGLDLNAAGFVGSDFVGIACPSGSSSSEGTSHVVSSCTRVDFCSDRGPSDGETTRGTGVAFTLLYVAASILGFSGEFCRFVKEYACCLDLLAFPYVVIFRCLGASVPNIFAT